MPSFLIEGRHPLQGEVTPSGNKNAALPLLTACLLTDEAVTLHNVPSIGDVSTMRLLLESLGLKIELLGPNSWRLQAQQVRLADLDPDLCRSIRASILLAGPMLARTRSIDMPPPGGDVIGRRRVDTHLLALQALGAEVEYQDREIKLSTPGRLQGTEVLLDEASVTATENTIMAAVTAAGNTVVRNAASEPHVQDLCNFLNTLGAKIENIGSNTLLIHGVDRLHGGEFTIGPDYLEVASFIGAAIVTGGEVTIRKAAPQHLSM
ncbi:MAG: UDP-N-acetylglucosamine 1-carboxyvinyltransferase, partial [Anaerolineales bacterium]